jgi:hypothetical protein
VGRRQSGALSRARQSASRRPGWTALMRFVNQAFGALGHPLPQGPAGHYGGHPSAGELHLAPQGYPGPGQPTVKRRLQPGPVGNHRGRGDRRCPAAEIGDLVAKRTVPFVPDGRHHRYGARGHGPTHLLAAPGQQRRAIAAASRQYDHVHLRSGHQGLQSLHDRQRRARTRHGRLLEAKGIAGKTDRRHRLDVLPHRGIAAAHDPDSNRQRRDGAPGPIQEPLGRQSPAGIGDELGDGTLAHRRDLLGHQVDLASLVDPLQGADNTHPLARHHPAASGHRSRNFDIDLGRPIPKSEENPASPRRGGPVDLTFDRYPTHPAEGAGDLAGQADQRDLSRRTSNGLIPQLHRHPAEG